MRSEQFDVYVIVPSECTERHLLWLIATAENKLVKYNSKQQKQCGEGFQNMKMIPFPSMPQLFYCHEIYGNLLVFAVYNIDHILISGITEEDTLFISTFNGQCKLVSIDFEQVK